MHRLLLILLIVGMATTACSTALDLTDPATLTETTATCDPAAPFEPAAPPVMRACEPTETCVFEGDGTSCAPRRLDAAQPFQQCTYANDCVVGSACTSASVCLPLCRMADGCDGGCIAFDEPLVLAGIEYGFCAGPPCNPFAREPCGLGTCRFLAADRTTCLGVFARGELGAPCTDDADCPASAVCDEGVCRALCRSTAPRCASGSCVPTALRWSGEVVGTCK